MGKVKIKNCNTNVLSPLYEGNPIMPTACATDFCGPAGPPSSNGGGGGGSIIGGRNGLSTNSQYIELGGPLIYDTTVNLSGFALYFNDTVNGNGINYGPNVLEANFTTTTLVTKKFVDDAIADIPVPPIPTLESVTDVGNTTPNAIQITGIGNLDLSQAGISLHNTPTTSIFARLDGDGGYDGSVQIFEGSVTITQGLSGSSLNLRTQTSVDAGAFFSSRVGGLDGTNPTDFITFQQLEQAIIDVPIPSLQEVTDVGNTTTDTINVRQIFVSGTSSNTFNGSIQLLANTNLVEFGVDTAITATPQTRALITRQSGHIALRSTNDDGVMDLAMLSTSNLTTDRTYNFPDASGTLMLVEDVITPTLQSVTTAGNITNQKIKVTGSGGSISYNSVILETTGSPDASSLTRYNGVGANIGSIVFNNTDNTTRVNSHISTGSGLTLRPVQTLLIAGAVFTSNVDSSLARVSGGDALNATEFVTLQQLNAQSLTFENGLTESGGIVKLGGTLTDTTTTLRYNNRFLYLMGATYINGRESTSTSGQAITVTGPSTTRIGYYAGGESPSLDVFTGISGIKTEGFPYEVAFFDNINLFGLKYDADYSALGTLDPRWIPDWGAVTDYVGDFTGAYLPLAGGALTGPVTSTSTMTISGAMEVTNSTTGLILKSPDGTRWRITIDNDGILQQTSI